MSVIHKVGMADLDVAKAPDGLTTLGLGSCVGIAIRDPLNKIGGLAHIMLPDSTQIRNNSNIYKFADTGIEELVNIIIKNGGIRSRLVAKIAGGAQMLSFQSGATIIPIGERNVEATKEKLKEMNIPILSEDVGKDFGRTVIFFPDTGEFVIRAIGKEEIVI